MELVVLLMVVCLVLGTQAIVLIVSVVLVLRVILVFPLHEVANDGTVIELQEEAMHMAVAHPDQLVPTHASEASLKIQASVIVIVLVAIPTIVDEMVMVHVIRVNGDVVTIILEMEPRVNQIVVQALVPVL